LALAFAEFGGIHFKQFLELLGVFDDTWILRQGFFHPLNGLDYITASETARQALAPPAEDASRRKLDKSNRKQGGYSPSIHR
jgi:hypothetical protein